MFSRVLLLLAVIGVAAATNQAGKDFLEANGKKEGVVTTASGLQVPGRPPHPPT